MVHDRQKLSKAGNLDLDFMLMYVVAEEKLNNNMLDMQVYCGSSDCMLGLMSSRNV